MSAKFSRPIRFDWDVKIPLRDGVRLSASVYMPANSEGPLPCIFTLTPYVSDSFHERATFFAKNGFPFVIVDSRGRGNSEGQFRPSIQEAKDGSDIVGWLARQSYCNGKVAMWGGSYAGYCQWATAKEFPEHLATIVPAAAPYYGVDFPMRSNIFYPYALQWLMLTSGRASQTQLFSDAGFWSGLYREWHESGGALRDLDAILGKPSEVFQEWLAHPEPDAFWDAHNPTADQYARLSLPILTITGSYDSDQPGALEHYRQHMRHAPAAARDRHYLIIGPWDHAGTRTPRTNFGGIEVGPASLIDLPRLHLQWYAWILQDREKPEFLRKNVAYYVIGADEWRYADTLEQITARSAPLYLHSSATPSDVFSSGMLREEPPFPGSADQYIYDPRELAHAELETTLDTESLTDQRLVYAARATQLVYHSDPLDRDVEISGFFRFIAWISIDQPDTDFHVAVYAIAPDGTSVLLSTDSMRARYRCGVREAHPIRTTEPLRYDFSRFTFISRKLTRGYRLRLVIGPINSIFSEKNYNSGGVVSAETMKDAAAVTVRLFHDAKHPSALEVPYGHSDV